MPENIPIDKNLDIKAMVRGVADADIKAHNPDVKVQVAPSSEKVVIPDGKTIEQKVVPPVQAKTDDVEIPDVLVQKIKPKAPAPKVEQKAVEDFDPNEIKIEEIDEKIRPNFAKLRDKLNGVSAEKEVLVKERDELKARIASGATGDPEVIKALQEENQKLQDLVARVNLEADPRFQAKYAAARKPIAESISEAIKSYAIEGMNADDVTKFATGLSSKDRIAFLQSQFPEELHSAVIPSLLPMFSQLDIIERNRAADIQNHKTTQQQIDAQNQQDSIAKTMAFTDALKRSAIDSVAQHDVLLQEVAGNDAWNSTVQQLRKVVDSKFASTDPLEFAQAVVQAQTAPIYRAMYIKERERREVLENAYRAHNMSLPAVGGGTPKDTSTTQKLAPMTADDAARQVTANMMRRASA